MPIDFLDPNATIVRLANLHQEKGPGSAEYAGEVAQAERAFGWTPGTGNVYVQRHLSLTHATVFTAGGQQPPRVALHPNSGFSPPPSGSTPLWGEHVREAVAALRPQGSVPASPVSVGQSLASPARAPETWNVGGQPMRVWIGAERPGAGSDVNAAFPDVGFTPDLAPGRHMVVEGPRGTVQLVGYDARPHHAHPHAAAPAETRLPAPPPPVHTSAPADPTDAGPAPRAQGMGIHWPRYGPATPENIRRFFENQVHRGLAFQQTTIGAALLGQGPQSQEVARWTEMWKSIKTEELARQMGRPMTATELGETRLRLSGIYPLKPPSPEYPEKTQAAPTPQQLHEHVVKRYKEVVDIKRWEEIQREALAIRSRAPGSIQWRSGGRSDSGFARQHQQIQTQQDNYWLNLASQSPPKTLQRATGGVRVDAPSAEDLRSAVQADIGFAQTAFWIRGALFIRSTTERTEGIPDNRPFALAPGYLPGQGIHYVAQTWEQFPWP